jgi:predicted O-linked N-acetylglucosamine transferase (SPINDLY family)
VRRREEAAASLSRALELVPDYIGAFAERALQRLHLCDWRAYEADRERLLALTREGAAIPPFLLRIAGASPAEMLLAARRASGAMALSGAAVFAHPPRPPHARLRVGYLSSDFNEHPVALLAAELFERHHRGRFELFAYSHGIDDGGPTRQRLLRAFDHFIDLRTLSDEAAARRIHEDGIDILVDLNGFTFGARPAILAHRPAPVQAGWLGYIGTNGADFIDYVIADRFALPAEQQPDYAERIVHLPHCYLPIDTTREIAATPTREACGLPEAGLVFCCFNNNYKLAPAMFAAWMRILARVPGSVLWLLGPSPAVIANLRREAADRGIAPDRLVFARTVPLPDYLARFRAADLFLDTLPCGACTTGSDALWAGLPLLTCVGATFAGRHAGSLLRAAGLPELVTHSLAEYEALAVRLATEPGVLAGLRQRLERNRATAPLFDTTVFARDLEAIYCRMAELHAAGEPPAAFVAIRAG